MRIEKTWTATSNNTGKLSGDFLSNLAGKWGMGIEVRITNPYQYDNVIENIKDVELILEDIESD